VRCDSSQIKQHDLGTVRRWMVNVDSSLTAAPSLVFSAWPFNVTAPRSTCSQA